MSDPSPPERWPGVLPLLPLRDRVIFPGTTLALRVERAASLAAVEAAQREQGLVLLVAQCVAEVEEPGVRDLHRVGCIARVLRSLPLEDGQRKVLVQGLARARWNPLPQRDPEVPRVRVAALTGEAIAANDTTAAERLEACRRSVEALVALDALPAELLLVEEGSTAVDGRLDRIAGALELGVVEAQELLELPGLLDRLERLAAACHSRLEQVKLREEVEHQVRSEVSRSRRDAYLREQMRAIQAQLGDADPRSEEAEEYRSRIEEAGLSEEARAEALKQVRRLERMHPDGPEANVLRSYLDWMVELPWSQVSQDRLDLAQAKAILDEDHLHLEGIKERILEFLGVQKLRGGQRGSILCLVGPPGVGKTSLGRSIARAMGREFVRISLGGVRDEAEIRGHRRTYIGALPGRIVQGLHRAGTSNPVFVLDEIDKIASDYRGDPCSALLEVLDPEQNANFSDHYLNVPVDLSRVLFVATANVLEAIPAPLRDRMEVIRLSGYTPEEKVAIARSHLIPEQLRESGLDAASIRWRDSALLRIVTDYTHEAGVRSLERRIAAICRKTARRVAEGDASALSVTPRALEGLLGAPRHHASEVGTQNQVGLSRGLAWTEAGGEVLQIEASLLRGRGLLLTGQIGEVMRESAQAALSWVRGRSSSLRFDERLFLRHEVHIHVPAGATPKDGPSAGLAIAAALLSLATGVPVRGDVAMTGEVTLRGRVLPVGGIREKALAALRAGISCVVLPRRNLRDVQQIPLDLRRRLQFLPVDDMDEALDLVLERPLRPARMRSVPAPEPAPEAVGSLPGPR